MSKNITEIVESLPKLCKLGSASAAQIRDAEDCLGIKFADEYKDYLSSFGAIMADGIELSGISKSNYRNVVFLTLRERELNSKVPRDMYVIEDTHMDSIIIWQNAEGVVYKSYPDSEPEKIANSLADYLDGRTRKES